MQISESNVPRLAPFMVEKWYTDVTSLIFEYHIIQRRTSLTNSQMTLLNFNLIGPIRTYHCALQTEL